ncbi:unnamed protein product [Calypogeia fissa]
MEKVNGDSPPLQSWHSSPRSTLGWKDAWGNESADLEPPKYKPLVGPSFRRSKSLVGLSSLVAHDGRKSPSHQLETMAGPSPTRCKVLAGLSSMGSTPDHGPETPPLQSERRFSRSLSPPLNANRPGVRRSLLTPESPGYTDRPATPAAEQVYAYRDANPPPTLIPSPSLGAVQFGADDSRGRGAQPSKNLWDTQVWLQDRQPEVFTPSSAGCPSARDDETSVGEEAWSADSPNSLGSSAATAASRERKAVPSNRMQFISTLNEELLSIKSCMKRAIDLGKKVQHYGALEVSQLREEKATAQAAIKQTVQVNRELEQQVIVLRDEVQTLQWERELEVLSMNNEIQELEIERNTLMKAARDEKKKREKLQSEVDSVLSVLLEEKMKLENEREAHDVALQNEKKKLMAMRKARDAALKALEEGNKKLEIERDAMLLAMRDITSRLDFERDAKLRSMRRTSMDVATMMSSLRPNGSRRPSLNFNEDGHPRSRPLSRQNSRQ